MIDNLTFASEIKWLGPVKLGSIDNLTHASKIKRFKPIILKKHLNFSMV